MLRAPTADDAPYVAQLVAASVDHLQPWLPWVSASYDEESAHEYFAGHVDPTAHPLLIFNSNGQLGGGYRTSIGSICENGVAYLGYWLGVGHTGRGYATRATNLVARHAIDTVGLERVEILCSVHNKASIRVAERSIATYEGVQQKRLQVDGVQHDAHCYVVLNDRD
ncbi:MAG: GNAT family N-acetyltransferase [Akkermansiaceae bacterium]|nr:GNAT family N-acetyltransferase [Akkermansiaceae bacterium]